MSLWGTILTQTTTPSQRCLWLIEIIYTIESFKQNNVKLFTDLAVIPQEIILVCSIVFQILKNMCILLKIELRCGYSTIIFLFFTFCSHVHVQRGRSPLLIFKTQVTSVGSSVIFFFFFDACCGFSQMSYFSLLLEF